MQVADKVAVPIAGGERLYNRWGVRPYLEDQSIDVLQPDLGLCGGFTETKKVCDYADIFDVPLTCVAAQLGYILLLNSRASHLCN